MYKIVTLDEVKLFLKISGNAYDTFLSSLIDDATEAIESYIGKKVITRQFIEYQDGKNKQSLITNQYPIYKISSIYDDEDHDFGSDTLIATDDYRIYYDEGKVELVGDEGSFDNGTQNVKVTYKAGFSRFLLLDETNNYIDVRETGGAIVPVEIPVSALPDNTIWIGYDADDLAAAIQTALRDNVTLGYNYVVGYNHDTQKFTISTNTNFSIKFSTGTSKSKSIAGVIGFNSTMDTGTSTSVSSTNPVTGAPRDFRLIANKLISFWFEHSGHGKGVGNVSSVSMPAGAGTISYITDIPSDVKTMLEKYARTFF
jgi:hypothetical protein